MKNRFVFFASFFLLLYPVFSLANSTVHIEITGINEEAKKNILSFLDVDSITHRTPAEIRQFFSSSSNTVKKALEPFGYFKARVYFDLSHHQDAWIAKFQVIPGPPVRINKLVVKISGEGSQDPALYKIIKDFPLERGQIFSVPKYNMAKKSLFNTALAYGYFDADFEDARIIINVEEATADIILNFNTGMRYRFGQVIFNDNPYDKTFLKRFAPFSLHEYYVADKIQEFQQALSSSGYFKEVLMDPQTNRKEDKEVPVIVTVKPRPARQYNLGLGYGTDTGPRGLASYEWRRVTADGQRFKAEVQASQIKTHLQMDYIIPGKKPATDQYILNAAIQHEEQTLGESDLQKIAASYMTQVWEWQQTAALTLQRERFSLEDQPAQTQFLLIPSINWTKIVQDDPLRPSRGSRMSLTFLGAPNLFANTPFLQGKFSIKTIYPVLKKDRLLLRGSLSYTLTPNVNDVPLSFQSLAGGSQSIRGYSYNSIGPGVSSWVGSLEYRRHIKGNWYAAAFYDAGNVSSSLRQGIKKGIGLGVVWQSPVGALQLTAAQAQDLPGKPIAIQFSMGPDL